MDSGRKVIKAASVCLGVWVSCCFFLYESGYIYVKLKLFICASGMLPTAYS